MLDATMLARMQFGTSLGFHYLFPVTTLGLTFCILVFQILSMLKKDAGYEKMVDLLVKILAPVFIFGVATGIALPFSFGTNWAEFTRYAGEVFGPILAIEAITAFSIESIFLGILVFGKSKVSTRTYLIAVIAVFASSHLSAFWIVASNSWMHTPAGFIQNGDNIIVTNLWAAIFNPSTPLRFFHTIMGAWITGAVICVALCALIIIKKGTSPVIKRIFTVSMIGFIIFPLAQVGIGHAHIIETGIYQPLKSAALEGIFTTQNGAPLYIFGIPNAAADKIHYGIAIPGLLSFLETGNFSSEYHGLNAAPRDMWPPVNIVFTTFHIMVAIGAILIGISLFGGFLMYRKKLFESRYIKLLPFTISLPYISNETGWISTEMGRQPWIIQNVLLTKHAVSHQVSASSVALSMGIMCAIYAIILISIIFIIRSILRKEIPTF